MSLTTPSATAAMLARVGMVIIGRNEGPRLQKCLDSVAGSGAVVYVDSGSTDDSVAVATASGAHVVELDLSVPFTAARARNAGLSRLLEQQPDCRYVQFVDGDCELIPGWVASAVDFLDQRPDVAVVCGRRMERHPDASIFNKMCHHEWNTPVGEAKACGGESLVRMSAFQAVGGFRDEQIAHEEPELCGRLRAMGHRIWRIDQPMSLHDAAIMRTSQFYARSRRAGFGLMQYLSAAKRREPGTGDEIISRAFFWAFLLPLITLTSSVVLGPAALLLLLAYPLQIVRYAHRLARTDYSAREAVEVALLSMLGKFAEFQGSVEFLLKRLGGKKMEGIFYR